MKRSMGFFGQLGSLTCGSSGRTGGRKDQCFCQGAPCAIQRVSRSISPIRKLGRSGVGGRHAARGVIGGDASNELARARVAGNDCEVTAKIAFRNRFDIESQLALALVRIRVRGRCSSDRKGWAGCRG